MDNNKIKVGITHGDINGIGYEILLKTFEDPRMSEICTPVVYGSGKIASAYRKTLSLPEVRFTQVESAAEAEGDRLFMVNVVPEDTRIEPGQATPESGSAALAALRRAVDDLKAGDIDVLVTCPINKHAIHGEEFDFPGHTEYLEAELGDDTDKAMMIMCGEGLRVALVTIHEPVSGIAPKITREAITEALVKFNASLVADFGVHSPRIAVLSLNPHAGDGGVTGTEETDIITPAIADATAAKVLAFGPYAADGFFGSGTYRKFDGILAMYHDQGLIPFKLLAGEHGVNYTAGLKYVRTSPDHGTAYDIVGKGVADPQSLREAIYMAMDIYRNRLREAEATANPLKKQNFDRGSDRVPKEKNSNNN